MKLKKPKIIVVVGPTASGKTGLAIKIAKKFGGEIVSADSRQIYRGMDIGTAKPTKKEMAAIPHYLIDINNPDENYTVAEYKRDAVKAIKSILKKGKLPILVGGTGLYVKSVIDNLEIPNVPPDPKLRQKLELRIKNYGLKSLYNELIKLDPEAAYIVDPHNPGRIIFDFIEFGIYRPKEELEKRIDKRIDLMMKDGFLKEVKELVEKYGQNNQNFDTIGYREIIDYLNRKITLPEAVELIKKNTRNYAKRQMTWFRKDKRIRWIKDEKEALSLGASFLS